MKFANRVSRIGESATLAVSRRAKELAAEGVEVIDLSAGEPDFDSPAVAIDGAIAALRQGMTRYTAAAGLPELRAALAADYARRFGAPWEAANVVVGVGGKAVLFEAVLALVGSGDEVILPSPYWVTFPEQVRFAGGKVVTVETRAEEGFQLEADAILAAMTADTRLVIVNSPCNPTGGVIAAADLRRVAEACAERGVLLLSDETYEHFLYDGASFASSAALAAELPETVLLVGSFSKTYAMTGWRVGYLLAPPAVVGAVTAIQSHATSNATTFAMAGALTALERAGETVPAMVSEYQARRDLVMEGLAAIPGFECVAPRGAFYAFPRVDACYGGEIGGSVDLCRHLLDTARVALVPGAAFGADAFLRVSFAASRDSIERGLARVARAVGELQTAR